MEFSFIGLLNNNQGVLGFLSLIITLIGLFSINRNITILTQQSQKSGDNGVNQQAKNGGINQNAGRDSINHK